MRHSVLCVVAILSAGPSLTQSNPPPAGPPPTVDMGALDKSVDPCVDFYRFACGSWMANNPIPGDKTRWGRFDELRERTREVLHTILESYAAPDARRDAIQQSIGDYYAACMNDKAVSAAGLKPLQAEFQRIAAVKDRAGLLAEVARLHKQGIRALFGFNAAPDLHDAHVMIANVNDGGITLPDREYYLKDDAKSLETRRRYVGHVQKMLELAGDAREVAAAEAKTIMALETDLAKVNMDRTARRDPRNRDHRMTVGDLAKLAPNFEFEKYFVDAGAPKFTSLNVVSPEFFKTISNALAAAPLEDWKTYLRWKFLRAAVPTLTEPFVQEDFEFWDKFLRGQKEIEVRWKRCTRYADEDLGEALGQIYVAKAFPAEAKLRTLELVGAIEKAMGDDLTSLSWMSAETRKKAQGKLGQIANKIGYPDKWRDYSSVKIARDDFYGNRLRANEFEVRRQLGKIEKPLDKAEWNMTPPTINAYYNPSENNINFPAGILQVPFYAANRDDAANYGGIGAVIGHELTHGFDDQGSKFDGAGNLTNWWTEKDRAEFDQRTGCLADEYEQFSPLEGVHLNGRLTLGENTADNGGLRLAYMALRDVMKTNPARVPPKLEGFTPEQRFFLGYAQVWCQNATPETSRVLAITDPHSPGRFRVNGVVVNSGDFQQAFACKADQPMASAKPCRVW